MQRSADAFDFIHRRLVEESAWAAAGDRGCHRLTDGKQCVVPTCPVCRPVAFAAQFQVAATLDDGA